MKRLIPILIMALMGLSSSAWCQDYVWINEIYYLLNNDSQTGYYHTATVVEPSSWDGHRQSYANIPATVSYQGVSYPVVAIADDAFADRTDLTSVTIGQNVTRVWPSAFDDCDHIAMVSLNASNLEQMYGGSVYIPHSVFYDSRTTLTTLNIGPNVTKIPDNAFRDCENIGSFIIPASVSQIGQFAFSGCDALNYLQMQATTPPGVMVNSFDNPSAITLIVPQSSINAYRNHSIWGQFNFWDSSDAPVAYTYQNTTLYYLLDDNHGTATVVFPTFPNGYVTGQWNGYTKPTGQVVIPNYFSHGGYTYIVNEIGDQAFYECTGITSITIGNNITTVAGTAFEGCNHIATVNLNATNCSSMVYRDANGSYHSAFRHSLATLRTVNIGSNVNKIPDYAFKSCNHLTSVTIPSSVTTIGAYAFYGSGLTGSLSLPSSLTIIDSNAFSGCTGLTGTLNIPSSVTTIGSYAFRGCVGLTGTLNIPSSVTIIDSNAFSGCTGLTGTLNIPSSVTTIGSYAFSGCVGLTGTLNIPSSVTTLGSGAFKGCSGFTSVNANASRIENDAFYGCSGLATVTIGANVTEVGGTTFINCNHITTVNFNARNCTSMVRHETETVYNNITHHYDTYDYYYSVFKESSSSLTTLNIGSSVTKIPAHAFYACDHISSLSIPSSVTQIGDDAFNGCNGLTGTLTIPSTVTTVGSKAFSECNGITSVNVNASVISSEAFYHCNGLTSVTIGANVTEVGGTTFINCNHITTVNFNARNCTSMVRHETETVYNNITHHYDTYDYYYSVFKESSSSLTTLNIGSSVTKIPAHAFYACDHISSLSIPSSVTQIGDDAFNGCSAISGALNLTSVTSLGISAFKGCSGLASVNVNASVISSAFYGCTGLTTVTIGSNVTEVAGSAFKNCNHITTVNFNASNCTSMVRHETETVYNNITHHYDTYDYYYSVFKESSSSLTTLNIGSSVTKIPNYAFKGCDLRLIEVNRSTPPVVYENTFVYSQSTLLQVPEASFHLYRTHEYWSRFLMASNLIVAGVPVTEENASHITGTGISGSVSYSMESNILTLNNATINCTGKSAIVHWIDNFTINLIGTNTITVSGSNGLNLQGHTTIQGIGMLNVTSNQNAIVAGDDLDISGGCSVTATGGTGSDYCSVHGMDGHTLHVNNSTLEATQGGSTYGSVGGFSTVTMTDCMVCEPLGAVWNATHHRFENAQGNAITGNTVISYIRYDLWISGTQISDDNASDVLGDGTVSYDPDNNILTLNGANIRTSNMFALKSDIEGLKIVLQGDNTLYASNVTAIYLSQQTTFQGTGRLDVTGLSAIETANGLVIQGGCAIIATATGFSNCAAIYTDASNTYSGRTSTLLINASTLNAHAPHSPLGSISGMASEPATQGSTVRIMPEDTAIEWDNTSHCYRYTPGGGIYNGRIIFYHSEYTLSVGGVQVNLANQDDVFGDGTVSYDPDHRTLTLNEAHITNTGSGNDGIQTSIDGLTIKLIGDNTITSGDDGIQITSANTTFTGFGTLTVNSKFGIWSGTASGRQVSFTDGCTVKLDGDGTNYGLCFSGGALHVNNATLWAIGSTQSVLCGSLSMEGVEISAPSGATFSNSSIVYAGTTNPVKSEYVKITPLPYDLWVAGTRVDGGNAPDVLGNGTVSYDANNNVLTLNGASINVSSGQGIMNNIPNLTIVLVGNNTITASNSGVYSNTDFTIEGRGSLNVTGNDGIFASGCNLTIQGGCDLTVTGTGTGNYAGIYGSNGKTLTIDRSELTVSTASTLKTAICNFSTLNTVEVTMTTPSNGGYSSGVVHDNGSAYYGQVVISPTPYNLWVAGTQVTSANAFDVLNDGGKVIYDAEEHVLTLNGASIDVLSGQGIKNNIPNLTIVLVGSNTIRASSSGIYSDTDFTIEGRGSLNVTGSDGIYANGCNLTLQGGCDLTVTGTGTGTYAGIYGSNGKTLTIDRCKLTVSTASTQKTAICNFSTLNTVEVTMTTPSNGSYSSGVVYNNGSAYYGQVVVSPTPYNIWIADTQVTSANCENFTEGVESGRVHYDPDEQCLYLDSAVIHCSGLGEPVIRVDGLSYLSIVLTGDNYLLGSDSDGNQAIELYGTSENELRFEGPGSLNANTNIEFQAGYWDVSLYGCSVNLGNEGCIYTRANSFYDLTLQGSTLSAYEVSGIDRLYGGHVVQPEGADVGAQQEGVILPNGQQAHNVVIGCDLNLWVAGTRVTSLNANNITGPGISGSVSYDCYSRILTLNNATIVTDGKGISNTMSDAWSYINLIGENTILSEGDAGIYTTQEIRIKGDGSLLTSGTYGIHTEEDIDLEGSCSVEAIGTSANGAGIYCASSSSFNKTLNVGSNNTLRAITNAQSSKSSIAGFKNISLINVDILQPLGGTYSQTYRRVNDANGNQYNGLVEIGYAEYDLWLGGTRVTSANASHIVGQQGNITGNVSYDRYTNTLTLNGATIGGQAENGITNRIDGLTIRLMGENTINSWGESLDNDGTNLTIKGTGTLTLEDSYSGIDAYNMNGKNLIIEGGCVVNIEHGGTYVDGGTLIVSNATLQSNGSGSNVVVADNLILDYVKISTPSNAVFNAETHHVEDANGNPVTGQFVIEPIKYDLWVAGTQVTAYNAANITGTGISGHVSYDAGNNVLTLNNANLICLEDPDPEIDDPDGIRNEGVADLTILLVGSSTIQAGDDGINTAKHTTITGGGTLNVTAPYGIYDGTSSGTNVVIADGCCINVTSTSYGICSNGSITVRNAEIKTTGNNYGSLYCKQLTLEGCSITSPSGAVWNSSTHFVENQGAVVKSQVVIEPIQYNLRVAGIQVTTANASNITGPGITSGMVSYDATSNTLTLRDAEITASAEAVENGIPNLGIVVEGVSNLSSANYGVRSYADFSIEGGGVLNIWSENNGIRADNSSLTISGGCTVHTYHVGSGLYPAMAVSFTLTVDCSTLILDPIDDMICPMSCGSYELVGAEFSQPVPATLGSDGRIYSNGNLYTGQIVIEPIKYELWVAGTQVTSLNADHIVSEGIIDGSVSYDEASNTLTLDNAYIEYAVAGDGNYLGGIITKCDNLTINLVGDNTIVTDSSDDSDNGILIYGTNTTFTGQGTLDIASSHGIWCFHNNLDDTRTFDLTFNGGCDVEVYNSSCGIYLNDLGKLKVSQATVSVYQPTACGIYLEREPVLDGVEILFPTGGYWNGTQIVDPDGSATQSVVINPCNVFLGTINSSWDVEGNWSYDILPNNYSKVHIAAPCVSGNDIEVKEIVIDDSGSLNLVNDAVLTVDNIVNDDPAKFVITYGQLYCDNEVVGTFHKNITMASSDATGWYIIAAPMDSPSIVHLTDNTYDLYAYDEDADQNEWQNYRDNPFSLVLGHGYLYANSATTDLVMTGTFMPSGQTVTVPLSYAAQHEGIRGFNLIGNPFPHNITMSNVKVNGQSISEFYRLVEGTNGSALVPYTTGDILPGEAFFIKATAAGQTLTIEGE